MKQATCNAKGKRQTSSFQFGMWLGGVTLAVMLGATNKAYAVDIEETYYEPDWPVEKDLLIPSGWEYRNEFTIEERPAQGIVVIKEWKEDSSFKFKTVATNNIEANDKPYFFKIREDRWNGDGSTAASVTHTVKLFLFKIEISEGVDKIMTEDKEGFRASITPDQTGLYHWEFGRGPLSGAGFYPNDTTETSFSQFTAPTTPTAQHAKDDITVRFTDTQKNVGIAKYELVIQIPYSVKVLAPVPGPILTNHTPSPTSPTSYVDYRAYVLFGLVDQNDDRVIRAGIETTEQFEPLPNGWQWNVTPVRAKEFTRGKISTVEGGGIPDIFGCTLNSSLDNELEKKYHRRNSVDTLVFTNLRRLTATWKSIDYLVRKDTNKQYYHHTTTTVR